MEKKSKLKLKGILFSILVTLQISLISAQGILNRPLSNDLALGEAIAALNYVLLWEITSWLDLTLFIASWAGFYFATRPLLLEIYGVILDNFPTSSSRNRYSTTDDGEPIGMKGLALTSSFVTTQIVGGIIGFIAMIAIGAIGLFIFAYTMIKGTPNYMRNLSNQMNGANGGGRTRGSNGGVTSEKLDEMKEELREEMQREEDIKQKISRLRAEGTNFDEAVSELENSNLPENLKGELESLKQEWHDEADKEYSLAEVLDKIAQGEKQELGIEMEVAELEAYIERELSHLVNQDKDLDDRIDKMRTKLEEMKQREDQNGVTPELREELDDFHDQLGQVRAEVQEALREVEEAKDKAEGAMDKIEELDEETDETENNVENAEADDETVRSEAEDEEEKLSTLEEQTDALKKDRREYQEAMEQVRGSVSLEESVAEAEDQEVKEEHDEMMRRINHEKEELKSLIQGDNSKIGQIAQDLKEKTDEIEEMREEWEALTGEAERLEMEEEKFNEELMKQVENLGMIRDHNEMSGDQKVYHTEEAISNIVELRKRMPPEIRKREEGEYLKNEQGDIWRLVEEIAQLPEVEQSKIERIENEYFPPLLDLDSESSIEG